MENIKVSVCCLAYNHELYIRDCLEGILNQETSFEFEILIHDDASNDQTPNIIAQYTREYPSIIKPIYQKENTYSKEGSGVNLRYNINRAAGKYIAICDGDDFWIDIHKLENQITFLEANPEYCLSHTGYYIIDEIETLLKPNLDNSRKLLGIEELLNKNAIVHSSVIYRNSSVLKSPPEWIFSCFNLDWALYLVILSGGCKIHFYNSRSTVYRQNVGISKERIDPIFNLNNNLELNSKLLSDYRFSNYKEEIFESIWQNKLKIMANYNKRRKYGISSMFFLKIFTKNPVKVFRTYIYSFKIGLINRY